MSENTISNIKVNGVTYGINDSSKASIEDIENVNEITQSNNELLVNAHSKLDQLLSKVEGSGIDTSDATATAANILLGQTAYVNGVKVIGTLDLSQLLPENIINGVVINGVEGIHVCENDDMHSSTTYIDLNTVTKFKINKNSTFIENSNSVWIGENEETFIIYDNTKIGTNRIWNCVNYPDMKLQYSSSMGWYFMDYTLVGYTIETDSENPFDSEAVWREAGYGENYDAPIHLIIDVLEKTESSSTNKYIVTYEGAADFGGTYISTGKEVNGYPIYTNGTWYLGYFAADDANYWVFRTSTDEYWNCAGPMSDYAAGENIAYYYLANATSPECNNVSWSNTNNWPSGIFTIVKE